MAKYIALLLIADCALLPALGPKPPMAFPDARVLYQPAFVRVESARRVTPNESGLKLLSLFGWTLGGVFIVDWTQSPVGPYREVAVLSSLVARGLSIGAWASHIVVTTPEAVGVARSEFGLPACLGTIDFAPSEASPEESELVAAASALALVFKTFLGTASPGVAEPAERLRAPTVPTTSTISFIADDEIFIHGWDGWIDSKPLQDGPTYGRVGLTLPSFSGCLPTGGGERTALLRYPLTLGPARRLRLRSPLRVQCSTNLSGRLCFDTR